MGNSDGGRIFWKDLLWLVLTIALISTSISMGALTLHSRTPHVGAVTQREMDIFSDNTTRRFDEIERKMDRILFKLDNHKGNSNGIFER